MKLAAYAVWVPLVALIGLPMCQVDETGEKSGTGGEGGEGLVGVLPGVGGGADPRAVGGMGGDVDSTGGGSGGRAAGDIIGGAAGDAGGAGGATPTPSNGGAAGWQPDCDSSHVGGLFTTCDPPSPVPECGANDDGLPCCQNSEARCSDLPRGWCGTGGQGPLESSCCEGGQRQACEWEDGESQGWYIRTDSCHCQAKRCVCDRGNLPN